ncbi:hypothetical protein V5P93_002455 [Actinokineospora auranticolor]|uniref:Uncharacterized protein n=1 Tax=Actinokineospora auranticolor TaxID=155976 RepID=A0A2S6GMQ2_9PSEU|nr:DUF6059 family protein [Actinokineospora auranticolor]PPK66514.1 hypothetical protein CLV40_110218 [Actinokineospora auranticolor]
MGHEERIHPVVGRPGRRGLLPLALAALGAALYPHPDFRWPQHADRAAPGVAPAHGHPERLGTRPTRAERALFRRWSIGA